MPKNARRFHPIGPILRGFLAIALAVIGACAPPKESPYQRKPDCQFEIRKTIYADDFDHGISRWRAELERGGEVRSASSALELDVPAGCTVWFLPLLDGPLMIEYEATVVSAGGANDR